MFKDYKVVLDAAVEAKIMYFVDKCDKEISGLGDAWLDHEKKEVRITSAFLVEQECGPAETELDDEAITQAMYQMHRDTVTNGTPHNLKFWWHSHVNMGVFWSGTDQDTMKKLSQDDWFINIVFNKKREKKAALSYPITVSACGQVSRFVRWDDDLPITSGAEISPEQIAAYNTEYDENYSEKTRNYQGSASRVETKGTDPRPNPPKDDIIFQFKQTLIYYTPGGVMMLWKNGHSQIMKQWPEYLSKKEIKKMNDEQLEHVYLECLAGNNAKWAMEHLVERCVHRGLIEEQTDDIPGQFGFDKFGRFDEYDDDIGDKEWCYELRKYVKKGTGKPWQHPQMAHPHRTQRRPAATPVQQLPSGKPKITVAKTSEDVDRAVKQFANKGALHDA